MHNPPTSFRFSPETKRRLRELSLSHHLSTREMLELLIDQAAVPPQPTPVDPNQIPLFQENPHGPS